ncbi:MAG: PEGA domain-containing protein, partial [Candidatus Nealsonbacteria bacterium]|nr:PEGA domain-containing protein [Candidatus Nealsonbacteria bacterium]
CCAGCVRRRMTIRTNPPGAQVYVDDYELGPTPISADFTYYGDRKIRLVKDGYETATFLQPVPAPWYQVPPLDFFSENLVPGEIRDQRTFNYQLSPQRVVPSEELLQRGEDLRRGVRPAGARPAPPVAPGADAIRGGGAIAPPGPAMIPGPSGVGGYPIHPLPPSGR